MFGRKFVIPVCITDPTADKRIPVLRAPTGETWTLEDAKVVPDTTTAASTADYWQCTLENGGTAGTAQTNIGGTAGGTAGWTANTPKDLSITAGLGDLSEGQYLNLFYNEEGTVAPGRFTVFLTVAPGLGSKAFA